MNTGILAFAHRRCAYHFHDPGPRATPQPAGFGGGGCTGNSY